MLSFSAIGQTMKFTEVKSASSVEQVALKIADTVYNASITSKGSYKIERISKDGNPYWMYLGYQTSESFEGKTVWTDSKTSKYWYYVVGDMKYPVKRYLKGTD